MNHRSSVGKCSGLLHQAGVLALPLQTPGHLDHMHPKVISSLTSESVPIAAGAGRRRGALGPDDRGKGTLLFDSRKN